jgi:Transglycosylase-like domain
MRTLVVCLALTLPMMTAASAGSHSLKTHRPKPTAVQVETCRTGCHIHRERLAVRSLRKRVLRRSLQAYLPRPRSARLSWRAGQVRRELAFWSRKDRRTRSLARIPLARRIPRWSEWHCIARYESTTDWKMSPTTRPGSGGEYWGGLQMDVGFMQTYGEDMIRRHHGGLANTWTAAEQIIVANRAWQTRGYQPWPNTSRDCGLR